MNEIFLDLNYFYDGKMYNKIGVRIYSFGIMLLTEDYETKVIAFTNCATELAHVIQNLEAGKYT